MERDDRLPDHRPDDVPDEQPDIRHIEPDDLGRVSAVEVPEPEGNVVTGETDDESEAGDGRLRRGAHNESFDLAGQAQGRGRDGARSVDPGADRCHHPRHVDRHLRFRPASVRAARSVPGCRRHPRQRADGRRGRGRLRRDCPRGRRPGGHPVQHRVRSLRVPLEAAPEMYETFQKKQDGCVKVVLQPEPE